MTDESTGKGIGERLRQARKERGLSQSELARRAGVSQSTVASAETGRAELSKHLYLFADILGVNHRWLMAGTEAMSPAVFPEGSMLRNNEDASDPSSQDPIMLIKQSSATVGPDGTVKWEEVQAPSLVFSRQALRISGSSPADCKHLEVSDDSMAPMLFEGNTMVIDTSLTKPREGRIYVVAFESEILVRQVFKQPGGGLVLHALNPRYPDKTLAREHLSQLHILGQLIYRAGFVHLL